MDLRADEYLAHYGILRRSGRYPWGSGNNPKQRSESFLDITNDLRRQGMSDPQIAKSFSTDEHPFTTADLRALRSRATTMQKLEQIRTAEKFREKGMGPSEIARRMNLNESTVRSLLEPGRKDRLDVLQSTAEMLKRQVEEKQFVDVGSNVEKDLPVWGEGKPPIEISPDKFNTALSLLKEEGYRVHTFKAPQVGTGDMTTYKVLVKPGVTQKEAWMNRDNIRLISEKTDDRGHTYTDFGIQPPISVSSKRVGINYKEDGGADADGVIYVRPGKSDLSMGKNHYAQVRIAVDGTHYLKGMAIYKDDLPPGVDLLFNTNKSSTGNKLDALKPLKKDPKTGEVDKDNPFGAVIKKGGQILDDKGKVSSAMNIINEEGDWNNWSRNLASQMLSKQKPEVARSQLDLTYDNRLREFDQIKALTNPSVKKKLLETFSDETDAAAVHLQAAAMPNQATRVILPSNHVKPTEIFAPTFENGTKVALIRYPHAGTFEIPELTVNNKSREVRKLMGLDKGRTSADAVVIHPKVAERLSGADFDGDNVVVIPNNRGQVTSTRPLEGLKNFDPQQYKVPLGPKSDKYPDGKPTISATHKGHEMGNITNLISDMTIRGANSDEISRAVRHSMVVIDSEKHNLDYKASARDNGIADLKRRYQQSVTPTGRVGTGASTLITRANAETHINKRKDAPAGPGLTRTSIGTIDNRTGRKVYVDTGELRKDGSLATFRSKRLAETDDAYSLVSKGRGYTMEQIYADHSNRLKALANDARKEVVQTKRTPYDPAAREVFRHEVESLTSKLRRAEKNAPLERQAQAVARKIVAQKRRDNPNLEPDEVRRIRGQALTEARLRTGAKKVRIGSEESPLTDREWQAIQAGAISYNRLEKILNNADMDRLRELATPKKNPVMTRTMSTRAKQMVASGYTLSEISEHLGIPISTIQSNLEGGE